MTHADRLLAGRAYTLEDVGCYVDGARGIHAVEKIIHLANAHGADLTVTLADDEFVNEMEDEADAYMNANYSVEGAFWGRNENGDWGLWSSEEALADQTRSQLDRAMEQAEVVRWPKSDPFIVERESDNAKIEAAREFDAEDIEEWQRKADQENTYEENTQ